VSDLSLCVPNHHAVQHTREGRRARIISMAGAVAAIAIVIGAIIGDHAPDRSKCDPEFGPFFTPTTSPTTITLGCFGPGPKHGPR